MRWLFKAEGPNGSTSFAESTAFANDGVVSTGTPALSTAQARFGSSSLALASDSRVAFACPSASCSTGTGNFTLEGWVRPTASPGSWMTLLSVTANASGNSVGRDIRISYSSPNGAGGLSALFPNNANTGDVGVGTGHVLPLNAWSHVALVRNGTDLTLYANGNRVGVVGTNVTFNFTQGNHVLVGKSPYAADPSMQGFFDEGRLTIGVARYTGASYTVPAAAFAMN